MATNTSQVSTSLRILLGQLLPVGMASASL
jgi:hypothetical protein